MKTDKLVIIGAGETALLAFEYFTHDSPYEVVAFGVEKEFIKQDTLEQLPVMPLEELAARFDPHTHRAFVAISYTQLNRPRTRLYQACKQMGFRMASYVSSRASVWHNVEIGENCMITEYNVLNYSAKIGNNVFLWGTNSVGHRSIIRDNVFASSQVVICGYCQVGESCFFGANSCVGDNVTVARDCVIGAGAVVLRDTGANKIYRGNPAVPAEMGSLEFFAVPEPRP